MKKKIMLIGGGGHCHSVLDSILTLGDYDEIGIIDSAGSCFMGVSVIGTDDDIQALYRDGWTYAFITVGSVGKTTTRRRIYETIKSVGLSIPSIIDPSAIVGRCDKIGNGVYIGKKAVVNAGSSIGECAIINTGAIVEHDCVVCDFSHISTGAVLCGQVYVGNDTHIGAGSIVRQSINIGERSLIGAGSIVVRDVPSGVIAYGNPCKVVG